MRQLQLGRNGNDGDLCCLAKIVYYIVLIAYHGCDIGFDWCNYFELYADKPFSGIDMILFCFSCAFGSLISLCMMVVYAYYIKYHWECLCRCCRGYKLLSDEECDHGFVTLELWFSALELLGKDDIQSGILFWRLYTSQAIVTRPSWYFIAFSVCSVCAHLKLCICFMSKLCGCGSGKKSCCNDDCAFAHFVCVIGFIVSAVFLLGLTVLSLVKYKCISVCLPTNAFIARLFTKMTCLR